MHLHMVARTNISYIFTVPQFYKYGRWVGQLLELHRLLGRTNKLERYLESKILSFDAIFLAQIAICIASMTYFQ